MHRVRADVASEPQPVVIDFDARQYVPVQPAPGVTAQPAPEVTPTR
jgi:hypothetical protein